MKVGDLVKNTYANVRCDLGIILEVDQPRVDDWRVGYLIHWLNPPEGIAEVSWNSCSWLEKV
jgi:hypothetical protein